MRHGIIILPLLLQLSYAKCIMGILVSCCLRLFGYDHLEGDSSNSRRKQNISSLLSDRDNPNVDGRRYAQWISLIASHLVDRIRTYCVAHCVWPQWTTNVNVQPLKAFAGSHFTTQGSFSLQFPVLHVKRCAGLESVISLWRCVAGDKCVSIMHATSSLCLFMLLYTVF